MSESAKIFTDTSLAGTVFCDVNLSAARFDDVNLRNAQFVNLGRSRHGVVPVSFYGLGAEPPLTLEPVTSNRCLASVDAACS